MGIVVDLDAIHPFEHQHAPRRVAVDHPRDDNAGSIGEDFGKPARVGRFLDVVDLFEDCPPEFAIKRPQVDEFVGVDEARYDPDDEPDRAQVHVDQLVDVRSLNFDGHVLAGRGEHCFVHLAERGGGRGNWLERAEQLLNRLVQLGLDNRDDVAEWRRRNFVLE